MEEDHMLINEGLKEGATVRQGLRAGAAAWLVGAAVALFGAQQAAVAQPTSASPAARGLPDFADLVDQVGPAVVNIRTTARVRTGRSGPQTDEDMQEFFRRYFGVPGPRPDTPRGVPRPEEEDSTPRGVGSGFLLSSDGYVITNAHVVDGASEVYVRLTDRREFKARVIGADERTDVAVVKIDATGLPAVRIGDVNRLRVGEWVIAIGSPFDLDNTVTAGIVSAKARDTGDFLPLIQTDVAINPGNSGGPLINLRGEVVGINSQIFSRSGGYMGISFAIPMDEAQRVADQLRTTGRVVRGRIGVTIDQVTRDIAESIGLTKAAGAFVRSVAEGSPAEKAGIEAGDIVTRFDGKVIDRSSDLRRLVGNTKPGVRAPVQVFRNGAYKELSVTVAELEPDRPRRAAAGSENRERGGNATAPSAFGLVVTDVPDAQRREMKVKGGVRIESAEGPAARAGLREGDVIVAIANTEISDAKEFEAVAGKLDKSKSVTVLFRRGEWAQYAVIRPTR
jgi:serine protease Do